MSQPGRIVILNGAPRSGKSTIAAAIQDTLPGRWISLGVDAQNCSLPAGLHPGIGLRPGGERPDLEPAVVALYDALYRSVAAYARAGFDVAVDVGHHDSYSQPLDILPACAHILSGLDVLFVGVHCPLDTIMARRAADPQGGFYTTDAAPVLRWQAAVHLGHRYDLDLDTEALTPPQCVAAIAATLQAPPSPSAFARLVADRDLR